MLNDSHQATEIHNSAQDLGPVVACMISFSKQKINGLAVDSMDPRGPLAWVGTEATTLLTVANACPPVVSAEGGSTPWASCIQSHQILHRSRGYGKA